MLTFKIDRCYDDFQMCIHTTVENVANLRRNDLEISVGLNYITSNFR